MSNQPSPPNQDNPLALTPGGPRPADHVHPVGAEEAVRGDAAGAAAVVSGIGVPATAPVPVASRLPGLVLTPGGFRPPAFVHHLPAGQALSRVGDQLHRLDLATNVRTEIAKLSAP